MCLCGQFAGDLRGQAAGVPVGAAEERGRNETDVCAEGEGEGGRAQGGGERGTERGTQKEQESDMTLIQHFA